MTRLRISVTGVDGTGKSTVVRCIRDRHAGRPGEIFAFRAPQYHEDPELPFGKLSRAIDGWSVEADRNGDVAAKAAALFLSMTLYGDVESFVAAAYRPRLLVAERQCILDSLAYARFYLPMLSSGGARAALPPGMETIRAWLPVVAERAVRAGLDGADLTDLMVGAFAGEPRRIVERLATLYNTTLPDRVVILTARPGTLAERLEQKRAGATVRELHERAETLSSLAGALREAGARLREIKPGLVVTELPTDGLSVQETADSVLALCK